MEPIRVLIADGDEDYRFMMARLMEETSGLSVAGEAGSTAEALSLISSCCADVVLLDLVLPGGDGVFLLEKLSQLPDKPEIVVNTSFLSPVMVQLCSKLKVSALMQKPSEPVAVLERILSIAEFTREHRPVSVAREGTYEQLLSREVTNALQTLGFSAQYKGYYYLRDAVIVAIHYGQLNRGNLKMVYTDVARLHGVSAASVERDIRTVARNQHRYGDAAGWISLMGVCPPSAGFTNMSLISVLAEHLSSKCGKYKAI